MDTDGSERAVGNTVSGRTFVATELQVAEGRETIPVLRDKELADFLALLFSDEEIARRPKKRSNAKRVGFLGMHISRQVCHYLHGSDLTERIYVAVRELQRGGLSNRRACAKVAKLPCPALQGSLGKSRRGRPSTHPRGSEFSRKIETIRSIVNRFAKRQHPWKSLLPERDLILEGYVGRFLWLRKAGIVVGSEYTSAKNRTGWRK